MLRLVLLIMLALPAVSTAEAAEMYRWTDADGVVHLTDDKKAVPDKYKAGMTVIGERKKEPVSRKAIQKKMAPVRKKVVKAIEKVQDGKDEAERWVQDKSAQLDKRLDSSLDDIKTWAMIAGAAALLAIVLVFIFIKSMTLRFMVIGMILACIFLATAALYFQRTMDKGGNIIEEVEKIKTLSSERKKAVDEIMKGQ